MAEYDRSPEEMDEINLAAYEIVTYGRDEHQAELLRDMLVDHDIPAFLPEEEDIDWVRIDEGIPVYVPAHCLEEAGEILEEIESIKELGILDPDYEDDDEDDEDDEDMQPLTANAYDLEDDDEEADAHEDEDEL